VKDADRAKKVALQHGFFALVMARKSVEIIRSPPPHGKNVQQAIVGAFQVWSGISVTVKRQTSRRLRQKSNTNRSIKDQNGVLLNNVDVLGRWREYFKDRLNPHIPTSSDTHEVQLGEEIPYLRPKSS